MLTTLLGWLVPSMVKELLAPLSAAYTAYINKQISEAELRAKVTEALLACFQTVEVAHADALSKTYASFMGAVVQSHLMQVVWASVTLSQLFVLLWHQVGIPAIVAAGWVAHYPSSGSTVEWAYALVAACVGMGPMVLRAGPGGAGMVEKLKGLVGK